MSATATKIDQTTCCRNCQHWRDPYNIARRPADYDSKGKCRKGEGCWRTGLVSYWHKCDAFLRIGTSK